MSQFIDRRLNGKNKSAVNRQRFIQRFRQEIKRAVSEAISKRSITDVASGEKITIPAKDISEPSIYFGQGGIRDIVYPGNKEFVPGDQIQRPPPSGKGNGNGKASNEGSGDDNFAFELSRDEFLELFFDDLALPDFIKTQITKIPDFKMVRAGYSTTGVPTNIDIVRTLRGALARKTAVGATYRTTLHELQEELARLEQQGNSDELAKQQLLEQIELFRKKILKIPFLDTFDLRYNNRIKQPVPTTQAVMFCLMDVSGSMDEAKKDIAKRFFILLYLFLTRNYERTEVVFIRHHTTAKEVDEQEFFYSRETGGTVVSSALELMRTIIQDRYPTNAWNIYAAQASDGDNWNADSPYCQELLVQHILPALQYFAYVEIMPRHHQSLWQAYLGVQQICHQFAMQSIDSAADIYPVFRELFKRQTA